MHFWDPPMRKMCFEYKRIKFQRNLHLQVEANKTQIMELEKSNNQNRKQKARWSGWYTGWWYKQKTKYEMWKNQRIKIGTTRWPWWCTGWCIGGIGEDNTHGTVAADKGRRLAWWCVCTSMVAVMIITMMFFINEQFTAPRKRRLSFTPEATMS